MNTEISINLWRDSLGHQVNVYENEVWDESLFRTFNDDDYTDSYTVARQYAESLFNGLKGGSQPINLYDEEQGETMAFLPAKKENSDAATDN